MTKKSAEVDWDRYALQYDAITTSGANPAYTKLQKYLSDQFMLYPVEKNDLVVDFGGGTGNFSIPLAQKFPDTEFRLYDTSVKMLEIAKSKADRLGLHNFTVEMADVEDACAELKRNQRPVARALMIHCLYAIRTKADPAKVDRVLSGIHQTLEDEGIFFLADVNRRLRTKSWIPYCIWHALKSTKSIVETVRLFRENDQARLANQYIESKQLSGDFLICTLSELSDKVMASGFSEIACASEKHYRGIDNFIIARK